MNLFHFRRIPWAAAICLAGAGFLKAQTFTTLAKFDGPGGASPIALIQAGDGNFYGLTQAGGQGAGVFFKMTAAGALTTLYSFNKPSVPSSLMLAKDGNFYGTTQSDGINQKGTIFKITPGGAFTLLYQFSGGDGSNPAAPLTQASDGSFYGTTSAGGSSALYTSGAGTIFQLSTAGVVTTLFSFSGSDGNSPASQLALGTDGNYYGVTLFGGSDFCVGTGAPNGCGTIFKVTKTGVVTTLYKFQAGSDSGYPLALIQGTDGNFYGVTSGAGSLAYNGTVFKMTPAGVLTTMHDFTTDSSLPVATTPAGAFLQAKDGNFYGGQYYSLFKTTPTGTTTLYPLCDAGVCGARAQWMIQGNDGNLYGAMFGGGTGHVLGASGDGTIFQFVPPAGPVVPAITLVANAEGEVPVIAPNTWVEVKGTLLAKTGDSRTWGSADFVNNQLPTSLDGVSATVNGKSAYVYFVSAGQVNILTPPDALPNGTVNVVLTNNGLSSAAFSVQAQMLSPSLFVFDGIHVAAEHLLGAGGCGGTLCFIGPRSLIPGVTTPAKSGETVVLFANGFGPTLTPVVSGSLSQSGNLPGLPSIKVAGLDAHVSFAGLVAPGEFQFNVTLPDGLPNGDLQIVATYGGLSTPATAVIAVQN